MKHIQPAAAARGPWTICLSTRCGRLRACLAASMCENKASLGLIRSRMKQTTAPTSSASFGHRKRSSCPRLCQTLPDSARLCKARPACSRGAQKSMYWCIRASSYSPHSTVHVVRPSSHSATTPPMHRHFVGRVPLFPALLLSTLIQAPNQVSNRLPPSSGSVIHEAFSFRKICLSTLGFSPLRLFMSIELIVSHVSDFSE